MLSTSKIGLYGMVKVLRDRLCQEKQDLQIPRIAKRVKKAFLSDQCKEIEKNNRMRKTRDLFKKIGAITGAFHEWGHDKGQKQ